MTRRVIFGPTPDLTGGENETSAARPAFWHGLGFVTAVDDERFPVMRREL